LCLLFLATVVFADDTLPELKMPQVSGPYCGIHSLHICLSTLGIETEFVDFISTRFVGSRRGSSAGELIDAAEHFGAHAAVFSNFTLTELYRINQPMILHFRSTWETSGYDHWVAFLGFDGYYARIFDHPRPPQNMPLALLLANWNGTAIVVSKEPVNTAFIFWSKFDLVILVGALFAIFYFCHTVRKPRHSLGTMSRKYRFLVIVRQAAVFVSVAGVVGIGYHVVSPIGFFHNPAAVAEVIRRYHDADIASITLQELLKELDGEMINANPPLLLDVRRYIDFQRGAIPQAVSLPVNSSLPERQEVLKGVQKSQRILIYCQSQYCGFANEMARFLIFNGYENIAIYRGGYREWTEAQRGENDDDKNESL